MTTARPDAAARSKSPRFPLTLPDTPRLRTGGATFVWRAVLTTVAIVGLVATVLVAIGTTRTFGTVIDAADAPELAKRLAMRAPHGGVVGSVRVQAGDSVRRGEVLVYLDTLVPPAHRAPVHHVTTP